MIIGIPQSTRRNAKYVGDQAKEIKFAYVNESLLEGPVIEAEFSNIIAFGRLGNKSHIAECASSKVSSFIFRASPNPLLAQKYFSRPSSLGAAPHCTVGIGLI